MVDGDDQPVGSYSFTPEQITGQTDIVGADDGGGYAFASGTSVGTVLTKLLVTNDDNPVVSATVSNGFQSDQLTGNDLAVAGTDAAKNTYNQGWAPAFFFTGGGDGLQLQYARQKRTGERIGASVPFRSGRPTTLTVKTERALFRPVLSATVTKVDVGAKVTFRVDYSAGDSVPTAPRYFWNFGDGQGIQDCSASGSVADRELSHQWAAEGNPQVQVGVCASGQTVAVTTQPITITVGPKPKPKPSAGPTTGGGDSKKGTAHGTAGGNGHVANGSQTGGTGTTSDAKAAKGASAAAAADEAKRSLSKAFGGDTSVTGVLLAADEAVPFVADTGASPSVKAAASRRPGEIPKDWRWLLGLLPVVLLASGTLRQTRWLAPRLRQPPWRTT